MIYASIKSRGYGFSLLESLIALVITGLIAGTLSLFLQRIVTADLSMRRLQENIRAVETVQRVFGVLVADTRGDIDAENEWSISGTANEIMLQGQGPKIVDNRSPSLMKVVVEPSHQNGVVLTVTMNATRGVHESIAIGAVSEASFSYLAFSEGSFRWLPEWRGARQQLMALRLTMTTDAPRLTFSRIYLTQINAPPHCLNGGKREACAQ